MRPDDVKEILHNNRRSLAFVIGNGINRYNNSTNNISWEEILKILWVDVYHTNIANVPTGISLTEFYDILDIKISTNKSNLNLQKEFCQLLNSWRYSLHHKVIVESIKKLNAPLLTTNFDSLLSDSCGLSFHKMSNIRFTDFYPWECYFNSKEINIPTDGFGIWHINGMMKYHRSIRLGLTHYMGSVERARQLIHKGNENNLFTGKDISNWKGYKTWLHIFFNKSLIFIGLGLEENEIFLRWLLIERSKYFKKYPERNYNSWYITRHNECSEGKRLYLESIGINIIEIDDYEDIYENIWENDWS